MKNNCFKRILSAVLCFAMVLPYLTGLPLSAGAAGSSGTAAYTTTDVEQINGVEYTVTRTTQYIGNRTYSVKTEMSANLSSFDHARVRTSSRNGYIEIQQTGYYLIELWGGRGASGSTHFTFITIIPVPTPGGSGAAGGYVYGKVYLKAGQVLAYNIGTAGTQSTIFEDQTGGVGGDSDSVGGTHGEQGSATVGAGGGYSAIYLFEEGEFKEEYITDTTFNIPEAARLSRYLMIAGGGGGGGAGMGSSTTSVIFNGDSIYAPNGGAGGSINRGVSMTLSGSDYDVPGYVFSGRNGVSSGQSNDYIGHGGSNVPGQISSTLMGQFSQNQLPNDWSGVHNPTVLPGAGGSGNFRGGGGGAGYAGGSGGLMEAQLIGANVGGGGGGSSFIAQTVNGKPIEFLELGDDAKYLSGSGSQPSESTGSGTGGAVQITYLSGETEEFYQEALNDITFSGTVSQYFDIDTKNSRVSDGTLTYTVNSSDNTTTFTASGLKVVPAGPNITPKNATMTLYLKAKEEFLGGNAVELLTGLYAKFKNPNEDPATSTDYITITPTEGEAHSCVNVPLRITVQTRSYSRVENSDTKFAASQLYVDTYADMRSNLEAYWECDYIDSIGAYQVFDGATNVTARTDLAPSVTTTYQIKIEVKPKYEASVVGPAVETVFTGKAVISVITASQGDLNDLLVTANKDLRYSDGNFIFSTAIDQFNSLDTAVGSTQIITKDSPEATEGWTAPYDGWYYVQAWGGNGGNGGRATLSYNYSYKPLFGSTTQAVGNEHAYGGSGGAGGKVYAYLYLQQGEQLTFQIGTAGSTPSAETTSCTTKNKWYDASSTGGNGGNPTTVLFGTDTVMIAGGGGGGGGNGIVGKTKELSAGIENKKTGGTAGTGRSPTVTNTTLTGTFTGSKGGNGSASGTNIWNSKASSGNGAAAGVNYKNTAYGTTQSGYTLSVAAQKYAKENITTTKSSGSDGQVSITMIEDEQMVTAMEKIKGLNTKVAFSRYFDLDMENGVDLDIGMTGLTKAVTANGDGSKTVTYTSTSYGQVAKYTYGREELADGSFVITIYDCDYAVDSSYTTTSDGYHIQYTAHLDFSYTLTPKEGFWGGNDVPLLAYGQYQGENVGQTGGVSDAHGRQDFSVRVAQDEDFMNLLETPATDYANVAYTMDMSPYLTVEDKTIHLGQSVNKTDLYTFTPPTAEEDWQDDYARFEAPVDEAAYQPTQTTDYPIVAGFAPTVPVAQKATIVESVPVQEYALSAMVYVEVPVTTQLTNLTYEGEDWTLWGHAFACTLTPKSGYLLPSEITVKVGGVEIDTYTYNDTLGTVQIDGEYVTGPIVISGAAAIKTYDIHFVYTQYDPGTGTDVQKEEVRTGIPADEALDWSWVDSIVASMESRTGYSYGLQYDTADGQRPATMPANNLWLYGQYNKNYYTLTVKYVYASDGEIKPTAAPDHTEQVYFEDTYSVTSPFIKGYMADQPVVTGTMGAGDVSVTVTYTAAANQLMILYQKADGTLWDAAELGISANPLITSVDTDQPYSVDSPEMKGYTVDIATVKGVMTADGALHTVTYTPNTYRIDYDLGDDFAAATLDSDKAYKIVQYGSIYGYDAEDKVFSGLPTAQIAGYTFAGWYKDAAFTQEVVESDTVDITEDTVLYAKWERTKFKLTVRYEFLYTEGDFLPEGYADADAVRATLPDHTESVEYGSEYSVTLPAFTGYSAYQNFGLNDQTKLTTLTGTMPGQNRLVVITFEINTYTIRFMDAHQTVTYSDGETTTDDTVQSEIDSFNKIWTEDCEDGAVKVKHNVAPVYPGVEPTHETNEHYTYTFAGWYGTNDEKTYGGLGDAAPNTFPVATESFDYYAKYTATENIVTVSYGSKEEYFTNVADAVECAETNISTDPTMVFRRNTGNQRVIDLNAGTLAFGNTYTGTTAYTVTLDLNGLALQNTMGQTAIDNTKSSLNIKIKNGDAENAGSITVTGSGASLYNTDETETTGIVAIDNSKGSLTVNDQVLIAATAQTGDATAIRHGASAALTMDTNTTVQAEAAAGAAVGIDVLGAASVKPAAVNVSGKNAVGIRAQDGATMTLSAGSMAAAVTGMESAMGIQIAQGAALTNTINNTQALTVTSQGDAYGICNEGTINSLNLAVTVTADNIAYGLYNNGGTVTVSENSIGKETNLRATGTAEGYGLYNAADGTAIGAEDGDKLHSGAFAGSSYGLYSADNSIYASGNYLYFKGADEEHHLAGVNHTGYSQIDATTQFEAGYYRLAAWRKIEFVTNGGTEIAIIEQFYDTPLAPVVTTRSGYTFVSWHTTETLDSAYVYPAVMPDEDLTLYAQWDLNTYRYTLDQDFKNLTINFYKTTTATTPMKTVELTEENNEFDPPDDLTYASSYYLYIHSGWYTSDGTYVPMYGDLSGYADEDGTLNLYAKYNKSSSSGYLLYKDNSFKRIGTDPNPTSVSITSSYNGTSNLYYMYYVVQADGDYTFNIKNSGSYAVYYHTMTYVPTKTTGYDTVTSSASTVSAGYSTTRTITGLKKGDAVAIAFRRYTSSTTYVSCYVTSTADLTQLDQKPCSALDVIDYDVTMGTATLPIADDTGHEGMKFAGWADTIDAPKEDRIMQITPEMVDTVPQWQTGELWQLYSQWEERTWAAYQSSGRDFTAFETTAQSTILDSGAVSVRFKTEQEPAEALVFNFANGLPAGTVLTLIDRSGTLPQYYTHTLQAATTELSSTAFKQMGLSALSFDGIATDVVLQICYQNAEVTIDSETVSLFAGDIVSEVDASYGITAIDTGSDEVTTESFAYDEEHSLNVVLSDLTGSGLPQDHKLFLRVRWDGVNLAPGSVIELDDAEATIYGGAFAIADTGMTVADITEDTGWTVKLHLPTMVQNEFAGKTFYYELCAAPNLDGAFGLQVLPLAVVTQKVTVDETESLTVDAVSKTVPAGEAVSVTVSSSSAEFYLYQQESDGKLLVTNDCATVFDTLTADADGKLSAADGGALVTNNTFTATVSANAVPGKYYLVAKLGDKYERILLKVEESAQ